MNFFWEKDEVLARLGSKMTAAFHAVSELARNRKVFMRDAAYAIAINRTWRMPTATAAGCRAPVRLDRGSWRVAA